MRSHTAVSRLLQLCPDMKHTAPKNTAPPLTALLTRPESLNILRMSLRKLEMEIAIGAIPVVRFGKSIRIRPEAIQDYIAARETIGAPKRRRAAAAK